MISAIVFTYWPEEEDYIEACLASVKFTDEIIVIDNGATSKTLAKVKNYTSKIYHTDNSSFAARHNLGREKARGDWLLYVDADERVSHSLREEIIKTLPNASHVAYMLNRVNYYLGKKVRYGDRFPDLVTRLFKKDNLTTWEGEIHESSKVDGSIGKLSFPLYHITHLDIFSMMDKTKNYAEHEANLRLQANHPPVVGWRLLRVFLTEFYNRLLKMQGFRQGTEGWIDGIFQAFSMFIVYARLWERQRKPNLQESYRKIDKKILDGEI